mmetsp:Transcript_47789/g.132815  ORF Transcript_47789/g.132815 Transcript_47789/m.132815 type:complete len:509 (-) Transcript_47789:140-1666(-)
MGRRGAGSDTGLHDSHLEQGEELLDAEDYNAAIACFEQALAEKPISQSAWYLRGVAASECWQKVTDAGDAMDSDEQASLLKLACESFAKVLTLDTSKRSENRYLASLSCAKLLTNAASLLDEDTQRAGLLRYLDEAETGFQEALRLHDAWGHADFDSPSWGTWGDALSQRMRLEIAEASSLMADGQHSGVLCLVHHIVQHCEQASQKFAYALQTREADESDDSHWVTLHVEHLLAFVNFVTDTIQHQTRPEGWIGMLQDLRAKAESAWCEAYRLADGNAYLMGGSASASWEPLALRGDALAAAASLLSALDALALQDVGPLAGTTAFELPSLSHSQDSQENGVIDAPVVLAAGLTRIGAAEAAGLAETAFAQAASCGGPEAAATVGLATGELLLKRARHLRELVVHGRAQADDALACLQRGASAFQEVAQQRYRGKADPPDARATAWYNLACIAGLLGKAEHAAQALKACIARVPAADRSRWLSEARNDCDLKDVHSNLGVMEVLSQV